MLEGEVRVLSVRAAIAFALGELGDNETLRALLVNEDSVAVRYGGLRTRSHSTGS